MLLNLNKMKKLLFILGFLITFNCYSQHGMTSNFGIVKVGLISAVMSFSDSAIVIQIDTQNKWYHITNLNNTAYSYIVESYGISCENDSMGMDSKGKYLYLGNISFYGDNQAIDWDFAIKVGDSVLIPRPHRSTNATGQSGNVTIITIHECAAGEKAILIIRNLSGTQNPTIESATIIAIRVGNGNNGFCIASLFMLLFSFIPIKFKLS